MLACCVCSVPSYVRLVLLECESIVGPAAFVGLVADYSGLCVPSCVYSGCCIIYFRYYLLMLVVDCASYIYYDYITLCVFFFVCVADCFVSLLLVVGNLLLLLLCTVRFPCIFCGVSP